MRWYFFLLLMIIYSYQTFASNQLGSYYIKRSPKGLLLGDAYVARAQDDHLLFYNPATLARNDSVELSMINFSLSANDVIKDKDRFDDVSDTPQGLTNQFMDYPAHVDVGTVPGMRVFNFGASLIYNVETNAVMTNSVTPMIDINYRYDSGFIMGVGFPIAKSGCGKFAIGGSAKYIKREGIDDRFAVVGTRILNAIENGNEARDVLDELGLYTDKAWGFDFASEYSCKSNNTEFALAASFLDVYTKFDVPSDKTLPEQPMTTNLGFSYKKNFGLIFAQISADAAPINRGLSFTQMVHAGLELGTPLLSVMGGVGSGGLSYGASLNLLMFKVIGGFYHASMGPAENPLTQRRAIIYLSLLDFSFDL